MVIVVVMVVVAIVVMVVVVLVVVVIVVVMVVVVVVVLVVAPRRRRLVAGLLPRKPGVNDKPVHTRCVMTKVTLCYGFLLGDLTKLQNATVSFVLFVRTAQIGSHWTDSSFIKI